MKAPCGKECPDREVGCHGRCEKWQAFEEWKAEEYERRRREYVSSMTETHENAIRKKQILRWKYGRNDRRNS